MNKALWVALGMLIVVFGGMALADHESSDITLFDGLGYEWDLEEGGYVVDGGQGPDINFGYPEDYNFQDTFDDAHLLYVNGSLYNAELSGTEDGGREAVFEEQSMSSVSVWRKVYVPEQYGFARFLQCFENTSGSPVTVTVTIENDLGEMGQPIGEKGGFYSDFEEDNGDNWVLWGSEHDDAESMVLFDGVGSAVNGVAYYEQADDNPELRWEFVIPNGQTKCIAYFAAQRVGFTDLRAAIAFLLAHPELAFANMSSDELENTCNWNAGDSDEDGLVDSWESLYGVSNPTADSDEDGLTNEEEYNNGTNPKKADTDGDGLNDGDEIEAGTDPLDPDTDNDGLADGAEVDLDIDPLEPDTDGDLVPDGMEVELEQDPGEFTDYGPEGLDYWTVFCGIDGDDETGDGTQANPFFSVDRAMENVPSKSLQIGEETVFKVFVGPGWYVLTDRNYWEDISNVKIQGAGIDICTLDGSGQEYTAFSIYGINLNTEICGFTLHEVDYGIDVTDYFDGLNVHDMAFYFHSDGIYMASAGMDGTFNLSNLTFRQCTDDDIYYSNDLSEAKSLFEPSGSGDVLNISNVRSFGNAGDSFIELYGINTGNYGTLNISNVVGEHLNYNFYIYDWDVVNVVNSRMENCYEAAYFGDINSLAIQNGVFSGHYYDECLNIDEEVNSSLLLRNNVFIASSIYDGGFSCVYVDGSTPSSENVEIRNNVFAFGGYCGLEWNGSGALGSIEDYNAFFGNEEVDVFDNTLGKTLSEPVGDNSISDTDGDFGVEEVLMNRVGKGVYTPGVGSVLLGAGDNDDEVDGNLDDNIGSNNSKKSIVGGQLAPDEGEDPNPVSFKDSDPDSDSYGAGVTIDLTLVETGGDVSISLLETEDTEALLDDCHLAGNEGRVFDISSTATFADGAIIRIQLPYRRGSTQSPLVYHLNTETCEWELLDNQVVDEILGLVFADHNTANGFSPFAVAGEGGGSSSLPPARRHHGGSTDLSFLLLVLAGSLIALRRRM